MFFVFEFSKTLTKFSYFRTLHLGIWFKTQGTVINNSCVGVVEVAVERLKENSSIRGGTGSSDLLVGRGSSQTEVWRRQEILEDNLANFVKMGKCWI